MGPGSEGRALKRGESTRNHPGPRSPGSQTVFRDTASGLVVPTARWYPLRPHDEQRRLWSGPARFRVAACGRRSGKSELAKRHGVRLAMQPQRFSDARYLFGGPTHQQAKRVFWSDLKKLIPRWALLGQDPRRAIAEGELTIHLVTGATIQVIGLDAPQRAEGVPLDFIAIDEAADVREEAWTEHLRPGLSERGGQAWLTGTPEGRNWFYHRAEEARESTSGLWSFHTWPSADILPAQEIDIARAELDERTFKQEYCASFETFEGRVYYPFSRETHANAEIEYDAELPLMFAFDFNVKPGVAVVVQEQDGGHWRDANAHYHRIRFTRVIDEVWIPDNSNTVRVCQELAQRWRHHKGDVYLYGDATGGSRGTSQTMGSDWDLVKQVLRPTFRDRLDSYVPRSNPPERVRINAVNSRLRSVDGSVWLRVDPKCQHLIEDLEGVVYREGSGEIDKKGNPRLTHISDALGYLCVRRYPVGGYEAVIEQV